MNIFLTDPCPRKCAMYLDDKRVNKMLLETAQLLSSAMRSKGFTGEQSSPITKGFRIGELPVVVGYGLYKNTHVNHPCAIWTRSSRAAFCWMLEHGFALADEYAYRYNTRRRDKSLLDDNRYWEHACVRILDIAMANYNIFFPLDDKPLVFNFNSSGFNTAGSVHDDYQLCMSNKWHNKDKQRPMFSKRNRPPFYKAIYDAPQEIIHKV